MELPSRGLNRKFRIISEHVVTSEIVKVFGADYSSFKSTNIYLHIETRRKCLLSSIGKSMDW